ncbi:hypothetical protein [Spirosoma sp.]|uniref:hypothetical protein n=1 Tax=Spirosoma sp. TaxID=1899569 RepID=UPI003B3B0823
MSKPIVFEHLNERAKPAQNGIFKTLRIDHIHGLHDLCLREWTEHIIDANLKTDSFYKTLLC